MTKVDSFEVLKASILNLFDNFEIDESNPNKDDIIQRNLFKMGLLADLLVKYLITYSEAITSDDINKRLQARMALSMINDIKETIEGGTNETSND